MNVPMKPSLINTLANRHSMDPDTFYKVVQKTVMPSGATVEQTAALLMVAHQYDLNPILKQIYAFPSKGGGITPIISVDGWCELINRQAAMDGMEFEDHFDQDGKVYAITCRMYRKDRSRPTVITEYLDECSRNTDPWKTSPKRMLRHRAMIQAARLTFGLSGAFDEGHQLDDAPVEIDMSAMQQQVAPPKRVPPPAPPKATAKPKAKEEAKPKVEAHNPETGEVFDPEEWLTDLDEHLQQAADLEQLEVIWSDFDASTALHAHPDHAERAKGFLDWHKNRIAKLSR